MKHNLFRTLVVLVLALALGACGGATAPAESAPTVQPVTSVSNFETPANTDGTLTINVTVNVTGQGDDISVEGETLDGPEIAHTEYWTNATEDLRWPDITAMNIIVCHGDPNEQGNAEAIILVKGENPITKDTLALRCATSHPYYNAYSGTLTEATQAQIVNEIQDSVRPHVPGFTLNNVLPIFLP